MNGDDSLILWFLNCKIFRSIAYVDLISHVLWNSAFNDRKWISDHDVDSIYWIQGEKDFWSIHSDTLPVRQTSFHGRLLLHHQGTNFQVKEGWRECPSYSLLKVLDMIWYGYDERLIWVIQSWPQKRGYGPCEACIIMILIVEVDASTLPFNLV